jgi:hypothetical protein
MDRSEVGKEVPGMVARSGAIGLALSLGLVFPAEAGAGVPERLGVSFHAGGGADRGRAGERLDMDQYAIQGMWDAV